MIDGDFNIRVTNWMERYPSITKLLVVYIWALIGSGAGVYVFHILPDILFEPAKALPCHALHPGPVPVLQKRIIH